MTFNNPALFKGIPGDTFIYFRTNSRDFVIKVGITDDLIRRDKEYSMYKIPTKYHTYSNKRFVRCIADETYENYMKNVCKSFGGINIDVDGDGHDNHEWFQFRDENSFRCACNSLSEYINNLH